MTIQTETKTRLTHPESGDRDWLVMFTTGIQAFETRWRFKSSSAPSNPFAGMLWIDDTSATSWVFKIYDGTDWITEGTLDVTANTWTPGGAGGAYTFGEASAANIWAKTADKLLVNDTTWSALAPQTLTSGTTITPDFQAGINFNLTLGHNATLANPTNAPVAGQSGMIVVTQDGTGSRTLSFGTQYLFPFGTAPTLTTDANAVDVLNYYAKATNEILISTAYDWS